MLFLLGLAVNPVYLSDSMQWGSVTTHVVSTPLCAVIQYRM